MLVLFIAEVVDDLLITCVKSYVDEFLGSFNVKFSFGSIVRHPGIINFYSITTVQRDEFSAPIQADVKLITFKCYPLSRVFRC